MAQHLYETYYHSTIHHIYKTDSIRKTTNSLLGGPHKDILNTRLSNEWGLLAQVNANVVHSTDTIDFNSKSDVPLRLLINNVISNAHKDVRFLSADLKDTFLHTSMDQSEYMRVPYSCFPVDICITCACTYVTRAH